MDVALGQLNKSIYTFSNLISVLILVVMDVALGQFRNKWKMNSKEVLILVVMDVALGQVFSQTLRNQ